MAARIRSFSMFSFFLLETVSFLWKYFYTFTSNHYHKREIVLQEIWVWEILIENYRYIFRHVQDIFLNNEK